MPEFEQWIAGLVTEGMEHLIDGALSHSPVLTAALADIHKRVSALETAAQPKPDQEAAKESQDVEQVPAQ